MTMRDDDLRRLLHQADRAAGQPDLQADLAGKVPRLARRRRRQRFSAGLAGLALAAGAAAWVGIARPLHRQQTARLPADEAATSPGAPSARDLLAEARRLDAEADAILQVVNQAAARENAQRYAALRRRLADLQADDPMARAVERAGRLMILQADRIRHEMNQPELAAVAYRLVVDQYPESAAAVYAKDALKDLQQQ